ncbi:MAG: DUF4143 domain-containing protein [Candidatus Accumulibacter sp.]|jgi:predicted AAA+ superfamily ATPase|nr:DUF4143 domain-containing protein [Accumulibacter sp.]
MFARSITPCFKKLTTQFQVVTLLGPRQSGKTTLCRAAFPAYRYANLEQPSIRQLAMLDPAAFFKQFPPPVIVDEAQRAPELLSHIQVWVDERKAPGQFILTGSHQPRPMEGITQSLAGRTAILTLLPLSIAELRAGGIELDRDEYIFKGFLPRIHDQNLPAERVHEDYYRTYVERDMRQMVNISNQIAFETFVRLLAGRVGQVANLHSLSSDVGISAPTLKIWLSVLEASFVTFRLPCYYNNFGKRITKAQKIYFTDVGLAAHLLGIESPAQVARDPLIGGLFENLVVMEALKARHNAGKPADLYYFRSQNGVEIDLILDKARKLHLFEIKASMTPDRSFGRHLVKFRHDVPHAASAYVIYAGEKWPGQGYEFVNFSEMGQVMSRIADGKEDSGAA